MGESCLTSQAANASPCPGPCSAGGEVQACLDRRRICGPRAGVGAGPAFLRLCPPCWGAADQPAPSSVLRTAGLCAVLLASLHSNSTWTPLFLPQQSKPSKTSSSIFVSRKPSPVAQVGVPFPCTEPHCRPVTVCDGLLLSSYCVC